MSACCFLEMHTHTHTHMHACMHTYIHVHMHTFMHLIQTQSGKCNLLHGLRCSVHSPVDTMNSNT